MLKISKTLSMALKLGHFPWLHLFTDHDLKDIQLVIKRLWRWIQFVYLCIVQSLSAQPIGRFCKTVLPSIESNYYMSARLTMMAGHSADNNSPSHSGRKSPAIEWNYCDATAFKHYNLTRLTPVSILSIYDAGSDSQSPIHLNPTIDLWWNQTLLGDISSTILYHGHFGSSNTFP